MGVNLRGILTPTRITLQQLSGAELAVDAYNAIYQFLAIIRGESGEYLKDTTGRVTSHLSGLFYRNVNLLMLGIKPVYILDGQPPTLKFMEIERRRIKKQEAVVRYLDALAKGRKEDAKKYAQATSLIKDYMVQDTKQILDLLGIPWIEAPSEGEATAAHITRIGLASATASQDFDSLLFGAPKLVRNVTISGRRKLPGKKVYVNVEPESIELHNLLSKLALTREQLVDLGILVGTDFNPDGFKGIGPVTALKYMREYGRLEDIPNIAGELESTDYRAIRDIFLRPRVVEKVNVKWGIPDVEGIVNFLCGERDFSDDRVRNALGKIEEVKEVKSESLEKWFD